MPKRKPPKPELTEQSWRLRAAMAWGRFETPAEWAEHTDESGGTVQSRVYGHALLREGLRIQLARAAGIDEDFLRDGGPEPFAIPAEAQAQAEDDQAPGIPPKVPKAPRPAAQKSPAKRRQGAGS